MILKYQTSQTEKGSNEKNVLSNNTHKMPECTHYCNFSLELLIKDFPIK